MSGFLVDIAAQRRVARTLFDVAEQLTAISDDIVGNRQFSPPPGLDAVSMQATTGINRQLGALAGQLRAGAAEFRYADERMRTQARRYEQVEDHLTAMFRGPVTTWPALQEPAPPEVHSVDDAGDVPRLDPTLWSGVSHEQIHRDMTGGAGSGGIRDATAWARAGAGPLEHAVALADDALAELRSTAAGPSADAATATIAGLAEWLRTITSGAAGMATATDRIAESFDSYQRMMPPPEPWPTIPLKAGLVLSWLTGRPIAKQEDRIRNNRRRAVDFMEGYQRDVADQLQAMPMFTVPARGTAPETEPSTRVLPTPADQLDTEPAVGTTTGPDVDPGLGPDSEVTQPLPIQQAQLDPPTIPLPRLDPPPVPAPAPARRDGDWIAPPVIDTAPDGASDDETGGQWWSR